MPINRRLYDIDWYGFDQRVPCPPVLPWDFRKSFAYRLDVDYFLSADSTIWPNLIDESLLPEYMNGARPFWNDLKDLTAFLRHEGVFGSAAIIAVGRISRIGTTIAGIEDYGWSALEPTNLEMDWSLLGFDVCDLGLLSGLSNCGIDPEDADVVRARFGPQLNKVHLFSKLEDASQFVEFADSEIPEHSPFSAVGVWVHKYSKTPNLKVR